MGAGRESAVDRSDDLKQKIEETRERLRARPSADDDGVAADVHRLSARAAAALSAAAALGFGYLLYESQWLRRVDVDMPVPDLPPALDGFTIVQLSDLHVGFRASLNMRATRKAVALARAAGADLIVITGDLVTGPSGVPLVLRRARRPARRRCGVFAVLGNHDHGISKTPGVQSSDLTGLQASACAC